MKDGWIKLYSDVTNYRNGWLPEEKEEDDLW